MNLRIIIMLLTSLSLAGCPLEGGNGKVGLDGTNGIDGANGVDGASGLAGINCWDLNGNRADDVDEDVNFDGAWNAKDCATKATTSQSAEVVLNHQHICEALANLNEYPEGCPSNTHVVPVGTLTKMTEAQFFDDGMGGFTSCNTSPNDGLLSIEVREDTIASGKTVKQGWFVLDGGYIAKKETMSLADAVIGDECKKLCDVDSNCIASLGVKLTSEAVECRVFYHSDTVGKNENICGVDVPGVLSAGELCLSSLGSNLIWASTCP